MYFFDKTCRLEIRLSPDDKKFVIDFCKKNNISISEFVREVLIIYAKNYYKINLNN